MAYVVIDEFDEECILSSKPSKNKGDKDWTGYWNDFYLEKNVSHKKALIKGMAAHSAEFVERYSVGIADGASDLK